LRKINIMNKKVLWISIASVATLGIGGILVWRYFKKKKENKLLEEPVLEDSQEIEETKEVTGAQQPPPHIDIQENVVYLSAKWCPACQDNKETAKALFAKYKDKVEFRVVDADEEIARSYGVQLGLKQIPVLAFVNEGKVVETMVGIKTMQEYDAMFEKFFPSLKVPKAQKAPIVKKVKKNEEKIEKKPLLIEDAVIHETPLPEPMVDGNGDFLGNKEEVVEENNAEKEA
jgi:thioredoxin 1